MQSALPESAAKPPCIYVIGPTACGKSALALRLAEDLGGELVNADAMQCYSGLDVVTNKPTAGERARVPHHLIGIVNPLDRSSSGQFDIRDYEERAIADIADIHRRGRVPVVCGGTNYYIQAVLADSLLKETEPVEGTAAATVAAGTVDGTPPPPLDTLSALEMFALLERTDPQMAQKVHPHDERKIRRALEIFHRTGQTQSELLRKQAEQGLGVFDEKNLRYRTLVIMPSLQQGTSAPGKLGVLEQKIEQRAQQMMDRGLLQEIEDFAESLGPSVDEFPNKGLLQSIGFKEFYPFLRERDAASMQRCFEILVTRTRQYAKRQLTWIQHQFVERGLTVYKVASHDAGVALARAFLSGTTAVVGERFEDVTVWTSERTVSRSESMLDWKKYPCEICGVVSNGEVERDRHVRSRAHRKMAERQKGEEATRCMDGAASPESKRQRR